MDEKPEKLESSCSGRIERALAVKQAIKNMIGFFIVGIFIISITVFIIKGIEDEKDIEILPSALPYIIVFLIFFTFLPTGLIYLYYLRYVKNFRYDIKDPEVVIYSGVFTLKKTIIPFSKIQNINIVRGFFDRLFGLSTIEIETAGNMSIPSSGGYSYKAEGYIPGLKDPSELEKCIKRALYSENTTRTESKEKRFTDPDLVFDEFTAYLLNKIYGVKLIKNRVRELREKKGLTQVELAEKIGVSSQTISYIEEEKFVPSLRLALKLSHVFGVKIEDIFILKEEESSEQNV